MSDQSAFRTDFPFEHNFEKMLPIIQQEYNDNYDDYVNNREGIFVVKYGKDFAPKGEWTSTWLSYNNEWNEVGRKYFPKTIEWLDSLGCVFHSQFSRLGPNSFLTPHNGIEKDGLQRAQLCLTHPDDAQCTIFAQPRANREPDKHNYHVGSYFYFDDRVLHWVGNPSKTQDRVVLLFDFWPDGVDKKSYNHVIYSTVTAQKDRGPENRRIYGATKDTWEKKDSGEWRKKPGSGGDWHGRGIVNQDER